MSASKTSQQSDRRARRFGMSDRTKISLLIGSACAILIGGGWWAYHSLSTVSPPKLDAAPPEELVKFLGNERGFARMSIPRREEYMYRAGERYTKGAARDEFNRALRQMSAHERQVFLDAAFEVGKVRFMEQARDFNQLPQRQQMTFVNTAMQKFTRMQRSMAGYSPSDSMGQPFKQDMPSSSDELTKTLVTRTTATERAEAQPLIDAMAERHKQLKDNPVARANFERGL